MPTSANTYGSIISVFVLFHSLTAYTRLSVVSPPATPTNDSNTSMNSSSYHNMTGHKLRPHRSTKLALDVGQTFHGRDRSHHRRGLFPNSTSVNTTVGKMYARRRSKYMADSDNSASLQNFYSSENDYNYHDYQSTAIPDLTTIAYPLLTTLRQRHFEGHRHRKPITKLYVKPVRRTVGFLGVEEDPEEEAYEGDIEKEIVPLASIYSGMYRMSTMPTIHISQLAYPGKAGTFAASSAGFSASGYGFSNERSTEHLYAPHAYHLPVSHEGHSGKLDLKKIGIIALVKIGLAKLTLFGVLKLLFFILLKFKLFLLLFFIKFLLFLKALKHLKALLLPFFLLLALLFLPLLLLPLLLPLLLLRYLLPLLLLLPTPLGRPANNMANMGNSMGNNMGNNMGNGAAGNQAGGNRIGHDFKIPNADPIMEVMMQLLDSEQCVERIACQLATKRESKLLFPIINW